MRWLKSLLVVLLFSSISFADDPTGLITYPPQKIMGFRGLDSKSSAPTLVDSRATDLLNVKLSSTLNLKKRDGYSVINGALDDLDTESPAVTGIFDTEFSSGTSRTIVFVGSKLKYDNSGAWNDVPGVVTITSGQDNQWKCLMALDNAICTNDTDVPIKISSAPTKTALNTSSLSDSLDKAKDIIWYNNYLIFGNTVENGTERPTRFRWSDVGTIETYQDANYVDISTFAGDEIVGFSEIYGELYIFLTRSIWKASLVGGDDVFVFKKVIDGIGAIARDSIRNVNVSDNRTATIFLSDNKKVYMFDGVALLDIGAVIQPTLDGLNPARLQYAVSTFDGESYYLSATVSGGSSNSIVYEYQTQIFEWTKSDSMNVNAFAQVKEATSVIKTYFGNYYAFVYWMDNPDNTNDVIGVTGVIDSVSTISNDTITGGQVIIDTGMSGNMTGALMKIVGGTGAGQEAVILSGITTGVIVSSPFSTTPDSTSVYTIGAINSYYYGKHYDFGEPSQEKQFIGLLLWAKEASSNEVDFDYTVDFGSILGSETIDLSPAGDSLWDVALWDEGTWGTTGDKIFTVKTKGIGNFFQPRFSNNDIDKDFDIYGFKFLAIGLDTKQ